MESGQSAQIDQLSSMIGSKTYLKATVINLLQHGELKHCSSEARRISREVESDIPFSAIKINIKRSETVTN